MFRRLILALLTMTFLSPAWADVRLDGTTLKIKATPDASAKEAGEQSFRDRLVFADGQVTATEGLKRGFRSADYETHDSSGGVGFGATLQSEKEGTSIWSGTLQGKEVQGTLIWRKPD